MSKTPLRSAFDIGGSKIEFARIDENGAVVDRAVRATPSSGWDAFAGTIRSLLAAAGGAERIGVSIAGTIDPATGIVSAAANVPVITGRKLEAELSADLGIPVRVGNDADCFALAEAHVGVGKGLPIVFGIILGTGVGGGLVIGGHLVRGAHGVTGEWGHGPVLAEAVQALGVHKVLCGCGQAGCVDSYGSARGMERIHADLCGETLTSVEITRRWHDGDRDATRTIEAFVELLAGPLSAIVNTLGPSAVPVGGGLSADAELIGLIDTAVRARVLGDYRAPLVVPGMTRGASGLIGAAMLAGGRP